MRRKQLRESPKDGVKMEDPSQCFKRVVSEGSTVILDVHDLVKDIDKINSIKHCLWKQTEGTPVVTAEVKDKKQISFIAPYVKNNDARHFAHDKLSIQLTIKEDDGKTKNSAYNVDIIVKRVQRAIIFQGGVALYQLLPVRWQLWACQK